MKQLYDHQAKARNELIASDGHPIFVAPTGSGKTVIAASYIRHCVSKGDVIFFNVHRQELIRQAFLEFNKLDVDCGILSSKFTTNPYSAVQICSVMTLVNRLDAVVRKPTKLIFDEAHHCRASSWVKIIDYFKDCQRIGLTATPIRTDGKGLDRFFTKIISVPDTRWHIENNYLANYVYYSAQKAINIEDRKSQRSMDQEAESRVIIGDVWKEYNRRGLHSKPTIAFCPTITKSKETVAMFEKNGIPAAHLDGTSDDELRSRVIAKFERGEIKLLSNVRLFTEGFNSPNAIGLLDLAPTSSIVSKRQRDGRVLRVKDCGSKAVFIDFVENWRYAGGFPDTPIKWSLKGVQKKTSEIRTKECVACGHLYTIGPRKCPACGYETPVGEAVSPEEVKGSTVLQKSWYDRMIDAHNEGIDFFCNFWKNNNQWGDPVKKFNEITERRRDLRSLNSYVSCLIYAGKKGYKKSWANIAWKKIQNGEDLY